jgi:hypothetical protein
MAIFPLTNRHLDNERQKCKTGHVKGRIMVRGLNGESKRG